MSRLLTGRDYLTFIYMLRWIFCKLKLPTSTGSQTWIQIIQSSHRPPFISLIATSAPSPPPAGGLLSLRLRRTDKRQDPRQCSELGAEARCPSWINDLTFPPRDFVVFHVSIISTSVQETREADNVPQDVHEISAAAPEAAPAGDPEGEGVRLRPGGASAQLRT